LFFGILSFAVTNKIASATVMSVGHWAFDESAGIAVFDSSGHGYDAVNHNTTPSTNVPPQISFSNPRSKIFTSSSNSYIDLVQNGLVGGGTAWTICGWFNKLGTALNTVYSEANTSVGSNDAGLVTIDLNSTPGFARLYVRNNDSSASVSIQNNLAINDGLWHLACGVKRSSSDYSLYVDNTQYNSTTTTVSAPTLDRGAIGALKRTTISNYFNGGIDDVRVYNRALSDVELSNIYSGSEIDMATSTRASATTSTVTANTSTLGANGIATTSITVTIRDATNTPIASEVVSLSSNRGASDTITPSLAITDSNGVVTFVISSSVVGNSVYTATDANVTFGQRPSVSYVGVKTESGVTYTSTLDNLSLKMDVSYDNSKTNLPIVLDLHGYSGPYAGDDIIQRLANKNVFAIKTYKRGYNGSQGIQDDSGREIYDLYDAIEYVKTHYSAYVDVNNINVIGYSGGGGNAYGLITKFPDYFRSANIFYGMSDYGHDASNGWYFNDGLASTYNPLMQTYIGGTPAQVPDQYYSRAHYLGAKNNPYSHIQLFYDTAETTCPVVNATQYTTVASAAGFSNIVSRISDANSTTTEITDDFSSDLSDYSSVGNGSTKFTYNNSGYIDFSGDRTSVFSSTYKKLPSLRNYDKTDHIKSSFNFSLSSFVGTGGILFGFRNSADTSLKNVVSILIINNVAYVRIDYNGTPLDSTNRSITAFTTPISTSTSYGFDLEINNSVVTAVLKDANGSPLETKTVSFDGSKTFNGVDSFGIYNFNSGDNAGTLAGTFDNLSVTAWTRWIHGYPQEGDSGEPAITAENYFIPDIVANTWGTSTLNTSGSMFIPGYIKTKKIKIFLGNGNDEAGNVTYDISGAGNSVASPKTLTVEGLTGTSTISLDMYQLAPNTSYNIKDSDLTHGGNTFSQSTTDSNGTLLFTGTLGSIHQYDIFSGSPYVAINTPSNTSSVVGVSSGGGIYYGCKDPKALNYESFAANNPALCRYSDKLTNGTSSTISNNKAPTFTRDLKFGMVGDDVKRLQEFLNLKGFVVTKTGIGSKGKETTRFGFATQSALIKFQKAKRINPSVGYFGSKTRSIVNGN